ncbi:gephyrin-like molybdotransferase Glp [Manganibacter manganicus]|uniref:Molybdopterin molybdenumtransferase n=1 Tax=Manganibacter manganicus TaxID=1873176 RepID=A0A1V8RSF9_9HYPH|nr:gephyrin-like molybdotransferase Glp [Pseudaminobacter manganicus]OQM75939.1 molybdopterin molybdenumtransferase MoeA [Pseudaminobacter manganicus]
MALVPVPEALERLLADAQALPAENVALHEAFDRVLAEPLFALRTQPPFDASAMDGYAVRFADIATLPARLTVIGTAAAGRGFDGSVGNGQAVRIFTGAPVPQSVDTIVIQENVRVLAEGHIEVVEPTRQGRNIRLAGLDFTEGDRLLEAGRRLDAAALSLVASANYPSVRVVGRPLVAIVATGDELLPAGSTLGPGQIISSNAYGVAASARTVGAEVLDLGIAADRKESVAALVRKAVAAGANAIVTLGGASVGDLDLVHEALTGEGMTLDFWKIAMRPGKPFMFGRLGAIRCLGLPGNPVASLVCSELFLKPLLARLGGRDYRHDMRDAILGAAMPANEHRQDYVRAAAVQSDNKLVATPFGVQDSSMLRKLADANALIVREPFAEASEVGAACRLLMLR